jgi:hypothetical protein
MKNIPQNILAFLAICGALFLIMNLQKPHSVCDSQVEVFKANQIPFLYLDPKKSYIKTKDFDRVVTFCKKSNSSGGCLEFFNGMKRLYTDLEKVPTGCSATLMEISEVKEAMFLGLELIVHLAWGERPPPSSLERSGWLDSTQVGVFCEYKKLINLHLGRETWNGFVEKQMTNLPGASLLPRNDVWSRTVLSDPCVSY